MNVEQIFFEAIDLLPSERERFLASACADQQELRSRVESLIAAHENSDSLLDTAAPESVGLTVVDVAMPKTIGDFVILGQLGRGGMGVVYKARQKSLNRIVALKVLSSGLGLSSRAILRFRREAEAAGKLHHTNIVPIYTTGEDRGVHYYAMEWIDGPSLDRVIRDLQAPKEVGQDPSDSVQIPAWLRETAMYPDSPTAQSPERHLRGSNSEVANSSIASGSDYFNHLATMIADVADALEHAHEHGVIHRDVKPSNLLLAPDGRLSINDFGLARMLEQPGMTMTGEFVGSPLYMSPEQITAGRAPLDHRTDIYSLGATLYELLTFQAPFPGKSRDQVIAQVMHKEPVSTRKLNRKVPIDLDTICMKAIEKDPDRRYQTAGQLADDLRRYVNRHAISARRTGPIGKVIRWTRRNPVLAMAFFAVFLACSATFWVIRENALEKKQGDLDRISSQMFQSLLRADFKSARQHLLEGNRLNPSTDWVHFSEGLISIFGSEYDAAKTSLLLVRDGENRISAQSLLAVAHMWSGNEEAYFRQLRKIQSHDLESITEFTDLLCLGYAHCWGEPREAVKLLDRALERETNHPFALVIRAQAERLLAMDLVDANKARILIEQALDDIDSQRHMIGDVPLLAMETTLVNLAAANIYSKLEMKAESELRTVTATKMEPILERFEDSPKVPYVLVLLLSHSDPRHVLRLDERWRRTGIELEPHTCNWMGINLLQCREYEKAQYWLDRRGDTPTRRMWQFLDRYVILASPEHNASLEELRQTAEADLVKNFEEKLVTFDVNQIHLFGGDPSIRKFIRDDTKHRLISEFDLSFDYFGEPPDMRRLSAADFIQKCSESDRPVFHRMHANFFLGVEALAAGKHNEAKNYFEACKDDNGFQFCVYRLSQALLDHESNWNAWFNR